ncbi:hypothetical protein LOH54_08380 [Sulfurimonas sp. HSL-3221]|uniref:hypothetical protein n=1 Tax=Sulfurimonadaceae TaxID=2771471 RepID=UPI001E3EB6A0|nr:hypothetical protein [Sulfurimonas sp. HSL-3221]UFS61679.1 hypothetical protein LOH54_08380 [Sulfurimonas sp. HSL-3221]
MVKYLIAVVLTAVTALAARPEGIPPKAAYTKAPQAKAFCAPLWISKENPNAGAKKWGGMGTGSGYGRPEGRTKLWLVTGGRGGTPRTLGSAGGTAVAFDNEHRGVEANVSVKRGSASLSIATRTPGRYAVYYAEDSVKEGVRCTNSAKYELTYGRHGDKVELNRSNETALPFEIVRVKEAEEGLFTHFVSGDTLTFKTLYKGVPKAGVAVTMRTGEGWSKRAVSDANGSVSFTLIKAYFPAWNEFDKRHEERFVVTAAWSEEDNGTLGEASYGTHRYVTTYPGRFFPEPGSYKSYAFALLFGTAALLLTGIFVYIYRRRRVKPYAEVRFDEKD